MASESSASSAKDNEKIVGSSCIQSVDIATGNVENLNPTYDRYLELHRKYEGPARAKLIRKIDWRLLPTLSFLYLMCSLDKGNAGNAKLFGLLDDVGMTYTQFNLALMYFFFTYGLCEPVSNIMLRRLGPKIWFPAIVSSWGLITALTSQIHNYGSFIAIRLTLGLCGAGLYPGSYFILSMWYTPKELATRHFPHQYNSATAPKKSKWLTPEELEYAQLRVQYANGPDAPEYSFNWHDVLAAAKDRKTYFMMMLFWWGGSVPTYSLSYTLPTMVNNLGYSAIKAQALTTPPYIFATCICVFIGWLSDRLQKRFLCLMACYTLCLLGIIILWITTHYKGLAGVSYFAIFLAAAGYSAQAAIVGAWTSVNVPNPSKRAAAIGLLMLFGSVGGGSIGSNIYLAEEAPTYPLGFGFSVGATVLGAMMPASVHWWLMRRENRRRDGLDRDGIVRTHTLGELRGMEENSPLFRYTL